MNAKKSFMNKKIPNINSYADNYFAESYRRLRQREKCARYTHAFMYFYVNFSQNTKIVEKLTSRSGKSHIISSLGIFFVSKPAELTHQ